MSQNAYNLLIESQNTVHQLSVRYPWSYVSVCVEIKLESHLTFYRGVFSLGLLMAKKTWDLENAMKSIAVSSQYFYF